MERYNHNSSIAYRIFDMLLCLSTLGIDEVAYKTIYQWVDEETTDLSKSDTTDAEQIEFWERAISMLNSARFYNEKRLTK